VATAPGRNRSLMNEKRLEPGLHWIPGVGLVVSLISWGLEDKCAKCFEMRWKTKTPPIGGQAGHIYSSICIYIVQAGHIHSSIGLHVIEKLKSDAWSIFYHKIWFSQAGDNDCTNHFSHLIHLHSYIPTWGVTSILPYTGTYCISLN